MERLACYSRLGCFLSRPYRRSSSSLVTLSRLLRRDTDRMGGGPRGKETGQSEDGPTIRGLPGSK